MGRRKRTETEVTQPSPVVSVPPDDPQNDVPISMREMVENLNTVKKFCAEHPEIDTEILRILEDIGSQHSEALFNCARMEENILVASGEIVKLRTELAQKTNQFQCVIEDAHQLTQLYTDQIENRRGLEKRYFSADSEATKDIESTSNADYSDDDTDDVDKKKQNEAQKLISKIENLHEQQVNPPKAAHKKAAASIDDENVASGKENYHLDSEEVYRELEKERIQILGLNPDDVEKEGMEKAIEKARVTRIKGFRDMMQESLIPDNHYFNAKGEEVASPDLIDYEITMNGVTVELTRLEQVDVGITIVPAHGEKIIHYIPVYRVVGMDGLEGKPGRCSQEEFDNRKIEVQRLIEENGYDMKVEGLNVAIHNVEARAEGHDEQVKSRKTTKGDIFVKGSSEPKFISRSYVTPVLLATLLVFVFYLGVPVTRLVGCSSQVTLGNIFIPTSVLYHWISIAYYKKLIYIIPLMQKVLLMQKYIHADETSFRVLRGDNKKAYIWVYATIASCATPVILYNFAPGRSGEFAATFLNGWQGFLITDAYQGYNAIAGAIHCFCLIHARRKFYEAATCCISYQSKSLGSKIVVLFDHIFDIERSLKDLSPEERVKERKRQIEPILLMIRKYCEEILKDKHISQGGKLAKAARYFVNNYKELTKCLENGNVPLHNMVSEHAIKHIALYRKNSLFCVSQKSGAALSGIMSIIFTAKANGLDPFSYLVFLFNNMKGDSFDEAFLETLLPWGEKAQRECKPLKSFRMENVINLVGGGIAA